MSYENFSVEKVVATFDELQAKRAGGFSAIEQKSEEFAVSYDSSGSSSGLSYSDTDYGNYYISDSNVYVYGTANSQISLYNGNYGSALNIDATSSSGDNILVGNFAPNIILGGAGMNYLWGIPDYSNDILVGGTGYNIFVTGKNEGNDTIINASLTDTVYLQEVTLSDIAFTASDGLTLGILFNTGNVLTINGTSYAGADIMLEDGSVYWYGYSTKTWHQTA